jgi:hypothetical protein
MAYRPHSQTLTDLRNLVRTLDRDRRAYDPVSLAQLISILNRRISNLEKELRQNSRHSGSRRAA